MNWKIAFKTQADSDWRIYGLLNSSKVEECHWLHYLLMASEKLAKSHLAIPDVPPQKSHKSLEAFIKACNHDTNIMNILGFKNKRRQYVQYLKNIKQIANDLLGLIPKDYTNINVEYPWQTGTNMVKAPCKENFSSATNMTPIKIYSFFNFIDKLMKGLQNQKVSIS